MNHDAFTAACLAARKDGAPYPGARAAGVALTLRDAYEQQHAFVTAQATADPIAGYKAAR